MRDDIQKAIANGEIGILGLIRGIKDTHPAPSAQFDEMLEIANEVVGHPDLVHSLMHAQATEAMRGCLDVMPGSERDEVSFLYDMHEQTRARNDAARRDPPRAGRRLMVARP